MLSDAPLSRNVAESTRQKIRAMAQKLGYHPDAYARSLRRRRSQTIGVLAYDLSDPYCVPIVRGVQAGLQKSHFLPLLMDAQTQRGMFDRFLEMILEHRAEGVIVIASWIFDETNLLSDIKKNNVPIVILSRDLTDRGISSVLVDNEAGGELAMRHLLELGHRQIAFVRGPERLFDSAPRWAGVKRVATDAGIRLDSRLISQLPDVDDPTSSFEGGLDCARKMLSSRQPFTAVLAFDDLAALGVVRGLTEAGLQIPADCSVVGFDGVMHAEVSTPGITTVRQPLREMGLLAADWTLKAIEAKDRQRAPKAMLHKAQPELVVRMSTSPPPGEVKNVPNSKIRHDARKPASSRDRKTSHQNIVGIHEK